MKKVRTFSLFLFCFFLHVNRLVIGSDWAMQDDAKGIEMGIEGRNDPKAIGTKFGVFGNCKEFMSIHTGISALWSSDIEKLVGGYDLGLRLSSPTRVSPFVGLEGFLGFAGASESAETDGKDNDGDGKVDERGEESSEPGDFLAAINPEIGAHFWLSDNLRLTGSALYPVTTMGRSLDHWYFRFGLSILSDRLFKSFDSGEFSIE